MFVISKCSLAFDPAEAVRRCAGWFVFEADPAVVSRGAEIGELREQRKRAGARLVAPRRIGDLHVRDAVGVVGDDLVDVVAVDGEVVKIGE